MGINIDVIEFLIRLRNKGYLTPGGAVIEIGAQQLGDTCLLQPDRLAHLGRLFGIDRPLSLPRPDPSSSVVQGEAQHLNLAAPLARNFWRWLGFEYAAVDIDGSPGSIPLDLNYDSVPPEAKGKYKLVTNFGTTEHIANQLNAFNVIHDLTAPNGIMIHEVPAQGMLNHGLINYNFKFFWMLSRSNGYKIIHADFMPSEKSSDLPENIAEFLNDSNLTAAPRSHDYKVADAGMLVVMQKSFDIAFVPPLDVDTGASTEIEALKKRYWTVFEPDAFDRVQTPAVQAADEIVVPSSESPPSGTSGAQSAEEAVPPALDSPPPVRSRRFGAMMRPLRTLRRLVYNSDAVAGNSSSVVRSSDATVQGIINQSDLINRKTDSIVAGIVNQSELFNRKTESIVAGIANQSDLIRRKLDSLLIVMNQLRDIQKAQLHMQRSAAEAIKQSASAISDSEPAAKRAGDPEHPIQTGSAKPALES